MTTARLSWTDRASALRSPWGVAAAAAAAVVALAYGPLLADFFKSLWAREYYQHFPFVLGAFAWLIVQRASAAQPREDGESPRGMQVLASALALVAWLLLAVAYKAPSPWLGYISFVLLAGSVIALVSSAWKIDGAWGVWLLLWLIVPLPLGRDQQLIAMLQRVSSRASSFVLDAIGVLHVMEGNQLTLPEKDLFVDEACSGIISAMAILACAAIYGVWRRRSLLHVLLLIVAGLAWATVMNAFRISAIAWALSRWNVDWSTDTPHEILSLVVFLIAFLALVSTDVLLAGVLAPVGSAYEAHRGDLPQFGARLARLWDGVVARGEEGADEEASIGPSPRRMHDALRPKWLMQAVLSAAFLALPAYQFVRSDERPAAETTTASELARSRIAVAREQAAAFLPERIGQARREQFVAVERERDHLMGNYSLTHEFRDSSRTAYHVSCDFPYEGGWHELTICYEGVGWTLDDRRVENETAPQIDGVWPRMEADFSKPDGSRAFVTVCAFDEFGAPIDLPTKSLAADAWRAITSERSKTTHEVSFQVQVFMTSRKPISNEQRQTARELMRAARDKFRALVIRHEKAPTSDTTLSTATN